MALDFGEFCTKLFKMFCYRTLSVSWKKKAFLVYFKFRQNRPGVIFFGEC